MSISLGMCTLTDDLWHFAFHQGLNLDEMLDCPDICTNVIN